jgi:hypothetical protein
MAQGAAVKHKKKTKSVLKNIRQSAHRAADARGPGGRRYGDGAKPGFDHVFRFGQGHPQEDAL